MLGTKPVNRRARRQESRVQRIERPKSLTELVADELRAEIVSGALDMGSALSEAGIARRLEVSRTPVREAFMRLEIEGLVRTEPQRGTFVFTLTEQQLMDICDVRVALEVAALRSSAARNPGSLNHALAEVVEAMTRLRKAGDDAGYLAEDTRFHQLFFDCADNTFLNDAYQTIASKMAALRNRLGGHPDHMAKSYREHARIAEQVAEGNVDAAVETLVRHIGRKEGSYWELAASQDAVRRKDQG